MPEGLALPYTFFAGGDSPDFAAQQNFQTIVTFVNRSLINRGQRVVVKATDETVSSSTTLQADNELTFTTEGNETYIIEYMFVYNSGAVPDFKFQWVETDGTFLITAESWNTTFQFNGLTEASAATFSDGFGSNTPLRGSGIVFAGATGGPFTLNWAQNTSNASNTTVLAGSYLRYHKVT